jgi:UDP-2,3-diacylglucosamine pyrophosphatase LpxH
VHLGSVHCKAEQLLDLLDRVDCQKLYLVGDIVDMWAMTKRGALARGAHEGSAQDHEDLPRRPEVIYIPGNHDANFREFCNRDFGNIRIRKTVIHETGTGQRMLVTHGDELDYAVRYSRLNRFIGDIAYETADVGEPARQPGA